MNSKSEGSYHLTWRRPKGPRPLILLAALALASISAPSAYALEPLEAFLAQGERESLEVFESKLKKSQQDALYGQATWLLFPTLSASAGYTRNKQEVSFALPSGMGVEQIVITPKNQLDAQLVLNVPLLDLSRWSGRSVARASVRLSQQAQLSATQSVREQVVTSYYQLIGAQAQWFAAQRGLEVAKRSLEQEQARQAAQVSSALEVERARAELAQREQLVARADQARQDARYTLGRVSRLSPSLPTREELEGVLGRSTGEQAQLGDEPGPLSSWVEGVERTPSVMVAQAQLEVSQAEATRQQRAAYLPTIAGQATQRWTNAAGFGPTSIWSLGVTARWSLDLSSWEGARASDLEAQAQSIALERQREQAKERIAQAYHRHMAQRQIVASANAQASSTALALKFARERYERDALSQLELIEAERQALNAELDQIEAAATLSLTYALLRLSAGQPLDSTRAQPAPQASRGL